MRRRLQEHPGTTRIPHPRVSSVAQAAKPAGESIGLGDDLENPIRRPARETSPGPSGHRMPAFQVFAWGVGGSLESIRLPAVFLSPGNCYVGGRTDPNPNDQGANRVPEYSARRIDVPLPVRDGRSKHWRQNPLVAAHGHRNMKESERLPAPAQLRHAELGDGPVKWASDTNAISKTVPLKKEPQLLPGSLSQESLADMLAKISCQRPHATFCPTLNRIHTTCPTPSQLTNPVRRQPLINSHLLPAGTVLPSG